MFKNLAIAVLLAIILTYSMGNIANEWFDIHLVIDDHLFNPIDSLILATLVCIILTVVGFCLALGVFGVILFVVAMVFAGVLIAGIGVFWPVILLGAVVYLLLRSNGSANYS